MELSNYVKIFKALSNEQRLKIFLMIHKGCCESKDKGSSEFLIEDKGCCPVAGVLEKAFTKVCGCMKLSKSTISHHFKELQNAGLITCERDGQMYRCKVNEEAAGFIKDFLK
ncbi:MAG: winged helix-turn-helix transcriptional regulator [Planctomycetes bacterium]|nr:winged helix-turn-helix transcriptional regulator [Planctomycetota bacterium]